MTHPSIFDHGFVPMAYDSGLCVLGCQDVGSSASIISATGRYYETRRTAGMRASMSVELHELYVIDREIVNMDSTHLTTLSNAL